MKALQSIIRPSLLASLSASLVMMSASVTMANPMTFSCGTPGIKDGQIELQATWASSAMPGQDAAFVVDKVNIPGGISASAKCLLIFNALLASAPSEARNSISLSGNVITINNFVSLFDGGIASPEFIQVASDTTNELSGLSAFLDAGQQVQITENPVISAPDCSLSDHLLCVAPVGETFSGLVSATGHNPFTFSAFGNGTLTYASLLGHINDEIASGLGIPDFCSNPNLPTLCRPLTAPFDPDTVSIQWDGNTALDLANFGLKEVAPPAVPEPSTMTLLGLGFAAIAARRRRRPRSRPFRSS